MKKLIFILLFFSFQVFALEEIYQFTSIQDEERFNMLTTQLRCLVCQNQNIAESNAPLANDLRNQIYEKIQQGQPNQEIVDYLVKRYGDFILYRPPLKSATYWLWFSPILILIFGLSYLFLYIGKKRRA